MRSDIEARPYQTEAIDKWVASIREGRKRGLVSLPTGCGKTLLGLLSNHRVGRTLWIAHREELIEQPAAQARALFNGSIDVGVVKADRNQISAKNLVVASVQTISRENRLSDLVEAARLLPFKQVVIDEAHHAPSRSYLSIMDHPYFASVPQLGLTATPERSDEKGLAKIWGARPLYRMTLHQAIEQGWLVPYVAARIRCRGLDLVSVPKNNSGDYEQDELEKEMVRTNVAHAVAEGIRDIVAEHARKTIVFTVSVNQAQRIAAVLRQLGVAAECVWGDMDGLARRSILAAHRAGKFLVLVNCAILTEGYDDSSISCVVMAKPTKSRPHYRQCMGRGLRLHPSKNDCLIVDLVGANDAHDSITAEELDEDEGDGEIGEKKKRKKKNDTLIISQDGEFGLVKGFIRASEYGVESSRARRTARVRWIEVTPDVFALSAGEHGALLMVKEQTDSPDSWRGYRLPRDAWSASAKIPIMRRPASQELTCGIIEDRARSLGVFGLSDTAARWRAKSVSEEQATTFSNLHPGAAVPTNRGDASDAISAAKLRKMFST